MDLFFSMKFLYFNYFFQLVVLSITDVCLSVLNYFNPLSIGTKTLGISCHCLVFYSEWKINLLSLAIWNSLGAQTPESPQHGAAERAMECGKSIF